MSVKNSLKDIITGRLPGNASSIFIEKIVAVIDESADTKESLLSAADRISKRIALFIDEALAKEIYEKLRTEVEKGGLSQGARRKHVRVNFSARVHVSRNGTTCELISANLSREGIFLKTTEPFAIGSKLELSLLPAAENNVRLKGVVVNVRSGSDRHQSGMGIEFSEMGDNERRIIRDLLKNAASQDRIQMRT